MIRVLVFLALLFAFPASAQQVFSPTPTWGMQLSQNGASFISDKTVLIGTRTYCWACGPNIPGVGTSFYMPGFRDPLSTTADSATASNPHDLTWFYNNHPDWLMYRKKDVTITIASPGVVTWPGHGLSVSTAINFSTTGSLPTGLVPGTNYRVVNPTTNTFQLAATPGGTAINTSGSQSGVHTATATATGGSGNLWAVNIYADDVKAYMLSYAKNPQAVGGISTTGGVLNGYNFLAMDNVASYNGNNVEGYYAGAIPGCPSGPPACGGVWTKRYSGLDNDPVWAQDVNNYLTYMKNGLNRVGAGLWINGKDYKNNVPPVIAMMNISDVVLRESQFAHTCQSSTANTDFVDGIVATTDWFAELQVMKALSDKKPMVSFAYLCNHPLADITNVELTYIVANYYLMRGLRTYLEIQNGTSVGARDAGYFVSYPAAMMFDAGTPVDPVPNPGPFYNGGPCPKRAWTKAYVAVWPSATGSCTYTVPAGTWKDMFGNSVAAGSYTLLPDTSVTPNRANAVVLVKQ